MIPTNPPSLAAWLLSARMAGMFDAITITSVTGVTARYTDADDDLQLPAPDSRLFVRGPIITRGDVRQTVGLSVDNLSISLRPVFKEQPVMFGARPLLGAAQDGTLRGAALQIERLVFDEDGVYKGCWTEFAGTLAVKSTQGGEIKAEVLSELNLLNKPMPSDVYQSQCANTVFDAKCRLDRSAWTVAASVASVPGGGTPKTSFAFTNAQAAGYFEQGVVTFTSGPNAGTKRTVRSHTVSAGVATLTFALPWAAPLSVADAFEVLPGCSRTLQACSNKFNNRVHFRGQPFIPQPETVN
ncbi:MAG: DUF2163 domain-containing protein [Burkholderiaceae bacterium]